MKSALLAALLLAPAIQAGAEPRLTGSVDSIPRNLVAGGGGQSSGAGYKMAYDVAENEISTMTGAGYGVQAGLMPMIAQPGTVTSLTAVTKDTGSIELAWTSPGLDGFVGDVVAGAYRIDYSSDPLHVFDPTVFKLQIATTVSPGAPQTYSITGLLANTTYFARVYLADARVAVAETSAQDNDSTLAFPPAAPVITGVFFTSVTFSWTLPTPGGAEGYRVDSSSTDFGSLFPGGVVVSSLTSNGLTVTLTVTGLSPGTTYYFKLASLDWQSDLNFTSILSTVTGSGVPLPIRNLNLVGDALARNVTLNWTNPSFQNPAGVTILVSSSPITAGLANGTPYPAGTVFGDGSVVGSSAPTPTSNFLQSGLTLNATAYFSLFSRDIVNNYSVSVSTYIVLNLPPMAPAGLNSQMSADLSSITLNWWAATSFLDGTSFRNPLTPIPWELSKYEIYQATGIVRSSWTLVASTATTAGSALIALPVTGGLYYYKVVSRNAFLNSTYDSAMIADTFGNIYAVGGDGVTRLQIAPFDAGVVTPGGNPTGRPLLIRAVDRPQDLGGRIVKSVSYAPVVSPTNVPVTLPIKDSHLSITLAYQTVGGVIVPSALGTQGLQPLSPPVSAGNAANQLSAYYVGANNDAAQIFGSVDTSNQTVTVQAGMLGNYQVRTVLRNQAFNFDLSGVSNKVITPNGDGINDTVVFTFDNPHDSLVAGKIYDMRGGFISDMRPGPIGGASLVWDGKAGGRVVSQGVYIYQIKAEGKTFNGTVVVIR